MRFSSIPFLLLAAVALACSGVDSKVATDSTGHPIIREAACSNCRVVAESIATIPHPDDTVAIRGEIIPTIDSRGRFYIAAKSGGAILAFGPNGRLLQSIGKAGNGPGELARVEDIYAGTGDTLFVSDGRQIHVFSPDYSQVREFVAGEGGSGLFGTILSGDRMLFHSDDHQFTIVRSSGETLAPVDLEGVDTTSRLCGDCGERVYRASRSPGLVWSGPQNIYRIEQHDTLGKLVKRITREVDWFTPWGGEKDRPRESDNPIEMFKRPRMFGVSEGSDGTLWAHVWSIFDTPPEELKIDPDTPGAEMKLFMAIKARVEAIDPVKNTVLGSINLPHLTVPISNGLSAQLEIDEAGDWTWKILRLRVVQ